MIVSSRRLKHESVHQIGSCRADKLSEILTSIDSVYLLGRVPSKHPTDQLQYPLW